MGGPVDVALIRPVSRSRTFFAALWPVCAPPWRAPRVPAFARFWQLAHRRFETRGGLPKRVCDPCAIPVRPLCDPPRRSSVAARAGSCAVWRHPPVSHESRCDARMLIARWIKRTMLLHCSHHREPPRRAAAALLAAWCTSRRRSHRVSCTRRMTSVALGANTRVCARRQPTRPRVGTAAHTATKHRLTCRPACDEDAHAARTATTRRSCGHMRHAAWAGAGGVWTGWHAIQFSKIFVFRVARRGARAEA